MRRCTLPAPPPPPTPFATPFPTAPVATHVTLHCSVCGHMLRDMLSISVGPRGVCVCALAHWERVSAAAGWRAGE